VWGTRFRIATFAGGALVGFAALSLLPFVLLRIAQTISATGAAPVSAGLAAWFAVIGLLWLGTVYIGAWYNLTTAGMSRSRRVGEIAMAVALAPVAGVIESSAAAWAVIQWLTGKRGVSWLPTPKTRQADNAALAKA
jgi:anaerobic C4-dicarboxylate transporter